MRTHGPPGTHGKATARAASRPELELPLRSRVWRRPDVWAVFCLFALTVGAEWPLLTGGTTVGVDAVTFFLPMYSLLGERLGAGEIPAWNPYSLSGAPFAADPQSGWMYWPAMLLFALLPLAAAAKALLFSTLLLAGVATYALARALGMTVSGALVAALGYEFSGYLYERNIGCFVCAGVAAWLPALLLCAELAIRAHGRPQRALLLGTAGFVLSQILSLWPGQGSYYALLALGTFVAYRTLISPPRHALRARERVFTFVLTLGGSVAFGLSLAAAGLLPRLEYNALSTLAGGYGGVQQQAVVGGWSAAEWARLLEPSTNTFYAGGAVLALALMAPLVAGRRFAALLWTTMTLGALVLTLGVRTPVHALVYLLPGFERLHPHNPGRILTLTFLGTALLAGATVSRLPVAGRKTVSAALFPLLCVGLLSVTSLSVPGRTIAWLLLAISLATAGSLLSRWRPTAPALLAALVALDLLVAARGLLAHRLADGGTQGFRKVHLETYYAPGAAAHFLSANSRAGPARFFGYDPAVERLGTLHRAGFATPRDAALLLNNRGTPLRLEDIQGYNPIQVARYREYMDAVNGRSQEYRETYVLGSGLSSPLLKVLNARYTVLPAAGRSKEAGGADSSRREVYSDGAVSVLEDTHALPRAWIVHSARQVRRGEALSTLASGAVDPATTVLLEEPPPGAMNHAPTAQPTGSQTDTVKWRLYAPEELRLNTSTPAPGLLVLSEVYYPAWKAYVDGAPSRVYVVNHALRGVALPAGEHVVELRYESAALRAGVAISAVMHTALVAVSLVVLARRLRRGPVT